MDGMACVEMLTQLTELSAHGVDVDGFEPLAQARPHRQPARLRWAILPAGYQLDYPQAQTR